MALAGTPGGRGALIHLEQETQLRAAGVSGKGWGWSVETKVKPPPGHLLTPPLPHPLLLPLMSLLFLTRNLIQGSSGLSGSDSLIPDSHSLAP